MRAIEPRSPEPGLPEREGECRLLGRLGAELAAHWELYARTHGQEIELAALIEALEQFLASDRGYQRQRHGGHKAAPAPASTNRLPKHD